MVEIIPVSKLAEDERGSTHFFNTNRTGEFIITYRHAGTASGRHYHKGRASNKNPEKIVLMNGTITLNWLQVGGNEKGSVKVAAPSMIIIPAGIWHEVIADTDVVILELNALEDGKEDTYRL
jgi:uncharacterized protein YjlB